MDGSASIGLEQALLGHSLGFAPMASPTQVYVALCLAAQPPSETVRGLEASGGGYVRTPATFALISGPSNIAANTTSVEFQQAISSWGVVGFFELWDAASGGNRLYWGQLVDPADFTTPLTITVSAGDIVRFSAGTLGVQAATGSGGTASIGAYLPLAGGTLTGPVYLAGDPTDTLQAATKQYVDAHSGSGGGPGFLPLSGGTMLGPLNYTATGGTTSRSAQDRAHDWINVTDFGAVLNGTTNDTTAWAAARAAATDYGTIVVPRGRQFVNTAPTGGPATPVLWKYDGNYVGSSGTTPVVGMGTDIVESFVGSKYFARSNTATGFLAPVVRIDSTVNHTGGVAHNTVTALRINATPTSSALEDTLGVAAVITSTKPSGGNLVAVTGYSVVSPTGRNHAAFGGNISATDNTGLKSSASGISSIGVEFDVLANDDDDAGAGSADVPANQGTRVVVDVVGAKAVAGGTDAVIGWGVRVGPTADTPGVSFRRNYAAYGPFLKSAFSTEFAVQQAGANAIWLGDGHTIALNKSGANTLGYTTTGTPRLRYMAGAAELWAISDTGAWSGSSLGTAIGQVPVFVNSQGSGFPGLNLADRLVLRRSAAATATDFADVQISRATTFNAGTPGGSQNNAALRVLGTYGANDKTNEWNIISTATTSGTGGGTAVGVFSQAIRAVAATDPIWGGIADAIDLNGSASSVSGAQVIGMEIDVEANKADDRVNPSSFGGLGARKGIDIVAVRKNQSDTTPYEVSHGIWFTAGTYGSTVADAYTNYQSAIGFGVNTQIRNALDTRGAITPTGSSNPVSAVTMSAGHIVDFNGGPALNSAPGNYLRYDSATSKLIYYVSGVAKWSVDASGNMRCAGTVTPSVAP